MELLVEVFMRGVFWFEFLAICVLSFVIGPHEEFLIEHNDDENLKSAVSNYAAY